MSDFSDADDSKLTATLRRRPVSRRIIAQEYQVCCVCALCVTRCVDKVLRVMWVVSVCFNTYR